MGKSGTLQLDKRQMRKDITEVYQLPEVVGKVKGQSYSLILQHCNQCSTPTAPAASWGDHQADVLLPREVCLGTQLKGRQEGLTDRIEVMARRWWRKVCK